jgi:acetyl esterase/lipase
MRTLLPLMSYAVIPNVTYRSVKGWVGKLDLIVPRAARGPTPTLIYYHGGAWRVGTKEERMPLVLPYMLMGFTIVNVEYRLSDVAQAPAAAEDARSALRWVQENANQTLSTSSGPVVLNVDLKRIVTSGTSAGGHLALLAGMAPVSAGLDSDYCGDELRVAAIIDWFGICDVRDLLNEASTRALASEWLGDKHGAETIATLVSPITYVRADVPPIISVHGDSDPEVPYRQKARFHDELERAKAVHELITINGGGHGIFRERDYLDAYARIRTFLASHLGPLESGA